ncbi:cytochrome d ubiquinol oxidase subunit II [Bacillus massiliigorillae]|uniref:cytochrome d ubiquinol oxidase subunit II n=1 Tax=Bacillus massiliigorillae TaxID=1243664 RepID=UPI0003AAB245|nr:cytochrome d ubiquinol oxidase subunit II [Bacillus massiliigorillae]
MTLNELWFILVAVLFVGFFFLEGFDFGVGMSTRLIAKNEAERDQLLKTIGPFWDANEVWLLTAGGAIFAAFPHWYATMFSGYYIPFVFFLLFLIARGVGIEYSHHALNSKWKNMWHWLIFIGSVGAPFILGVLFTSLVQGMPIDETMTLWGGFTDYVNLYSVVGGVAVVLLTLIHGLTFIGLRTMGNVHDRAIKLLNKVYIILFVGLVAFAVLTYTQTDLFDARPVATPVFLVAIVITAVLGLLFANKRKEGWAFTMSGLTIALTVIMLFVGLFPRVMISSLDTAYNLTINNAASGHYTLSLMTKISLTLLPFVLGYQIWSYYVFRKRISDKETVNHK